MGPAFRERRLAIRKIGCFNTFELVSKSVSDLLVSIKQQLMYSLEMSGNSSRHQREGGDVEDSKFLGRVD